jgi:hypothetical protein
MQIAHCIFINMHALAIGQEHKSDNIIQSSISHLYKEHYHFHKIIVIINITKLLLTNYIVQKRRGKKKKKDTKNTIADQTKSQKIHLLINMKNLKPNFHYIKTPTNKS